MQKTQLFYTAVLTANLTQYHFKWCVVNPNKKASSYPLLGFDNPDCYDAVSLKAGDTRNIGKLRLLRPPFQQSSVSVVRDQYQMVLRINYMVFIYQPFYSSIPRMIQVLIFLF